MSAALDTLSVWNPANTTRVALTSSSADLQLLADRTAGGARLEATMTMTGTQVAITFGGLASGSTKVATATTPMRWTPSTSATDLAGNPVSGAVVVESGRADSDFWIKVSHVFNALAALGVMDVRVFSVRSTVAPSSPAHQRRAEPLQLT